MDTITSELAKMNINCKSVGVLQEKDGVVVARINCGNESFIMKFFQNPEFRREIDNYRILSSLNIPALNVIFATDKALLIEDVGDNDTYRLGTDKDLRDPEIAVLIARWYKLLHRKGYGYIEQNSRVPIYDENDVLTIENIEKIKSGTNTSDLNVWSLIEDNFSLIKNVCKN